MSSRRFVLQRNEDFSGVSGVGDVADGIEFPDGTVAMRWRGSRPATSFYESADALISIHGHEGRTTIRWVDE